MESFKTLLNNSVQLLCALADAKVQPPQFC